jgi:hypothetical protein
MSFHPKITIKKVSKNSFIRGYYAIYGDEKIFKSDGEVYEMAEMKGRNTRSLRKIFVDLRQLIKTNFQGDPNHHVMLTLTYRENMQDHKRLYKDWEIFWKKYKRRYGSAEYIIVVEPQGRGAWHIHALIKSINAVFTDCTSKGDWEDVGRALNPLWGNGENGYVKAERLYNCDHIGAYFIAYFSNWEIPKDQLSEYEKCGDVKEIQREDGSGTKKVIKGERIKFYDDYVRIYRNSRGIVQPDARVLKKNESEYEAYIKDYPKITYENHKPIKLDDGKELHVVKQQRVVKQKRKSTGKGE